MEKDPREYSISPPLPAMPGQVRNDMLRYPTITNGPLKTTFIPIALFSQRLLFLYNVPVVSHSLVYFNQRLLR